MQDYLKDKQEVYKVATVLPVLSDAALFVQDQENKADFVRMLLTLKLPNSYSKRILSS